MYTGCMINGSDSGSPTVYFCRYRLCSEIWVQNLHSKIEARIHKYSIASDEAEVLKYYRDSKDPEIDEMHP